MKKQEKILCSENTRYIMTSTTSQTSGITFICLVPEQLITSPLKRLSLQMAKTGGKEILPHGYTKGEAGKSVNCPTVLIPW